MSLEYPHKIAEKDGLLHKNAKKYGCLSYLWENMTEWREYQRDSEYSRSGHLDPS